jgi:hypothetical protein
LLMVHAPLQKAFIGTLLQPVDGHCLVLCCTRTRWQRASLPVSHSPTSKSNSTSSSSSRASKAQSKLDQWCVMIRQHLPHY